MTTPEEIATARQREAANPAHSVALRAAAGSGKTRVLVSRFLRLCIEDGPSKVHPRAILAVTFTRKAAVEIKGRLLAKARRFALLAEDELATELAELFGDRATPSPSPAEMTAAACLLEQILEDTSGLNVGTIHSFCQLILGRFAAEAGLDPHFSVLENQEDLLDEALELLEGEMAVDSELRSCAATVGTNPLGVRKKLRQAMHQQMRLGRWLRSQPVGGTSHREHLPALMADLRAFLFPDLSAAGELKARDFLPALATELEGFAGPGVAVITQAMGAELEVVKPKNLEKLREQAQTVASKLREISASADDEASFEDLVKQARSIFLTSNNECRQYTLIRKDPAARQRFIELVASQAIGVLSVLHRLSYVRLYRENHDLLNLTLRLLDIYDELKQRDRVVDFQDLEDMACRLMGDEGRVGELLFRLDDSLSHILLDEFQDTNFNQWDMLRPFVDEFLAADVDGRRRTLFFVGDIKQSIYGFRGAEPQIFSRAGDALAARGLPTMTLPTNFRSLEHIVGGVGQLFNVPPLEAAFSPVERQHVRQEVSRTDLSAPIRILRPFAAEEGDERSGDQLAAAAAAALVRSMKDDGTVAQWADVLILSRSRTEISLYEKAFRDAGIPFVPAGRGMLGASREVQDILALLRWLLWPDDDAALATVLRSPIFRLDEKTFQELLGRRHLLRRHEDPDRWLSPDRIWQTLRKLTDDGVYGRPARLLKSWRKHLGYESCHGLLRRIFREGEVLERYRLARGDQAQYNLQRLFDLSLSPRVAATPTVRNFVDFIQRVATRGGQEEGALPQGGAGGRVRFMTIHGAKGLQAKVVLLVDANRNAGKASLEVAVSPGSTSSPLLFGVTKNYREGFVLPEGVSWPQDPLQMAGALAKERRETEDASLLYVALTRAEDRLYVLGGDRTGGEPDDSPLKQVLSSVAASEDSPHRVHFQVEDAVGPGSSPASPSTRECVVPADDTRLWQPPVPREAMRALTPSAISADDHGPSGPLVGGGAVPETGAAIDDPVARGTQVHLLLQLAADYGVMPGGSGPHWQEAGDVFADAELAWVFRPQDHGWRGLSEVPFVHRRAQRGADGVEERLTGVIDRLVIRDQRVDIIDYKTNRLGGEAAVRENLIAHYRPQLAAYREAVAALYPGFAVRTWLLFTDPELPACQRLAEVETI